MISFLKKIAGVVLPLRFYTEFRWEEGALRVTQSSKRMVFTTPPKTTLIENGLRVEANSDDRKYIATLAKKRLTRLHQHPSYHKITKPMSASISLWAKNKTT